MALPVPLAPPGSLALPGVPWPQLAPIDRGGRAGARLGAPEQPPPLTSGAKVQAGESLSRAAVPPRSAMRLGLLCGFAVTVALVAAAGADHGDSKKVARGREVGGVREGGVKAGE